MPALEGKMFKKDCLISLSNINIDRRRPTRMDIDESSIEWAPSISIYYWSAEWDDSAATSAADNRPDVNHGYT